MATLIRPPSPADFAAILPVVEKAKRRTRFGEDAVDLLHIKRLLAVGEIMPDVYARVVIHKGVLVGFFFGAISVSAWGAPVAQELVCYSPKKTDVLIQGFIDWARGKGAKRVLLSDESSNTRYRALLERMGFSPTAVLYSQEI